MDGYYVECKANSVFIKQVLKVHTIFEWSVINRLGAAIFAIQKNPNIPLKYQKHLRIV